MPETENRLRETERESGFVTMKTHSGNTFELFIMSREDFNDMKPQEEDFQLAGELARRLKEESRLRYNAYKASLTELNKPVSNRDKILHFLKR